MKSLLSQNLRISGSRSVAACAIAVFLSFPGKISVSIDPFTVPTTDETIIPIILGSNKMLKDAIFKDAHNNAIKVKLVPVIKSIPKNVSIMDKNNGAKESAVSEILCFIFKVNGSIASSTILTVLSFARAGLLSSLLLFFIELSRE